MTKRTMSITEEECEHAFIGKVAEHFGCSRQEVLHALYFTGKRVFLAKVRAKILIKRLKEKYSESPQIDQSV